ncbi:hypothetical protein OG552_03710 [Streptomyces sp. NBC_01476]|uniref:hypothetical protein n=1 Tax=Streptomyces sp. NBC_01476 TaxID=2903881 RepID=UPI002E315C66|nr:hypothetical protein [Streptomyces sp. NBC_01476]
MFSTQGALAERLARVRWIAGGTGAGKSTVAGLLAARYGVTVLDGDRADHGWAVRADPDAHPRLAALARLRPGEMWAGRSAREVFEAMPGLHGETAGFLVADLLSYPPEQPVVVDYFGILPRDLAPLLARPEQAVHLLPTPAFRRRVLSARYADPARARANWGGLDPAEVLERRLDRDALWDAEVRAQADPAAIRTVDGTRSPQELARELAARFGLLAG